MGRICSWLPSVCLVAGLTGVHAAAEAVAFRIDVDHPITVLAADGGPARVVLTASATGFQPGTIAWAAVADRINPLRAIASASITSQGMSASAQLTVPGVYQFQATTPGKQGRLIASTWVQVWDQRTPLMPGATLGTNPGVAPPVSVRRLSTTPAAGLHPRVLFSDADWPEMRERIAKGRVAGWGATTIAVWVKETLDNPKDATGAFAQRLGTWAVGGDKDPAPDAAPLAADGVLASEARGSFASMLLCAGYLQWLDCDPRLPHQRLTPAQQARGRSLAQLTAAAARLRLRACWDGAKVASGDPGPLAIANLDKPGQPIGGSGLCDLAMAYDLIAGWMTDQERRDLCNLLVAVGYGRHFSGGGFVPWGPDEGKMQLGCDHNGDFGNLNDHHILAALVVEGEEERADPALRAAFATPAAGTPASRWMKPADAADPAAWPMATQASVDNQERQFRWMVDWFITPWGFAANHLAYLGLTAKHMLPATLAFARRGENAFVTAPIYQVAVHALVSLHPAQAPVLSRSGLGSSDQGWWDHHDGGSFAQRGTFPILAKYMYPDDPLIDYVWRAYLPGLQGDPLLAAMFGIDPQGGAKPAAMAEVAAAKQIAPFIFDPQRGIAILRSGWRDEDLSLWFECLGSDPYAGHMHAERNSFDLFALGRPWSIAPGYHCTVSDLQAAILVKDPRHAADQATEGFLGASPSSATQRPPLPGNHPSPPGRILEVTEAVDHRWCLVAGDATLAYNLGYHGKREVDTRLPLSSFLYPGLLEVFLARSPAFKPRFAETLKVSQDDYNPMRHVIRTLLVVRGPRPYVLVVDDVDKDGQSHDWRWSMNCAAGFAPGLDTRFVDEKSNGVYSSLAMLPGASSQEAVLFHDPIDRERTAGQRGLPRMLLRDLGACATDRQPAIVLQSRPPGKKDIPYLTYGYDNNRKDPVPTPVPSNRVLIERRQVAQPGYIVLLSPFRTGEPVLRSTWDAPRTTLTLELGGGISDRIAFDRARPDHRTRLTWTRNGGTTP